MLSLAGLAHDGLSGGLTRRHSFRSISTSLPLEGHVDLLTSVIELVRSAAHSTRAHEETVVPTLSRLCHRLSLCSHAPDKNTQEVIVVQAGPGFEPYHVI